MEKKYELLKDDTIIMDDGTKLYRIKALKSFGIVRKGALGGYIEKEDNLSHRGNCWVYDNARVYGNAVVCANAKVYDNARVYDGAKVYGDAVVFGNAMVCEYVIVCGNAVVSGKALISSFAYIGKNAIISSTNDYITIGPIGSREDYTTFYKSKDNTIMVSCGCFNDTIEEFKNKVLKVHGEDTDGKRYLEVIAMVNKLFKL